MFWKTGKDRVHLLVLSAFALLSVVLAGGVARADSIFPVSADVATVKADLILWATALIGVALAIYAFRRVRGLVR